MRRSQALYVEVLIRADVETVWALTQDPDLHPRWDLRFSRIEPTGSDSAGRSRFRYERALPLHVIRGEGVSLGEKTRDDGIRTSALAFSTDDRLSPLRSGRGYWRYVPTAEGVRFITGYDYQPGWGRVADLVMRPAILWMTAWSFDRLRIWAERGEEPNRWPLLSVVWFWHSGRPRASRCRTVPPRDGAMADAPQTLQKVSVS
ncbi:SRPBCC family protein [Microbacterium sp. nov. GSS16]|uniref:SRPBCC family protein n=1 Tax=Microbacterium sp. nov. GSS16 TaxID=3019890 RepID=UPI0023051A28|nr:SRPBCC family protein [Microbacterium sp. nov. GSS16]WCD92741.1 SRPBCC family protein [Microbacterium sp. nov. GSS16]